MTASESFTFALDGREVTIGRDPGCEIHLAGVGVSRYHAGLQLSSPTPVIADLRSSFGLKVNGSSVKSASLCPGDLLEIGVVELRVLLVPGALTLSRINSPTPTIETGPEHCGGASALSIGRDSTNDIRVCHPLVSRFHARIIRDPRTGYVIIDNGSTNGTYVNGRPVRHARIVEGTVVQIGPYRFSLTDGTLTRTDDANRISIEAMYLTVNAGKNMLLDGVSVSIAPGQFIALLGPSGAGKSTLVSALSGRIPVAGGAVFYNGLPLKDFFAAFSARIGFVSQDNVLHPELSVIETFTEQSILRLPKDSIAAERQERIREVMDLLDLTPAANRRIRDLSGGEAKRVHFGIELLSSPTLIFLDEPLAGLDTGLIRRFMELFRTICDRGHSLILATHTLEQITVCDRVLFMNHGAIVYDGSPQQTPGAFGVDSLGQVYEMVKRGAGPLKPVRRAIADGGVAVGRRIAPKLPRGRTISIPRQLSVLVARYGKVFVRDRRNLLLVGLQAPLIALLIALVFKPSATHLPVSFYFSVCISAIWFGGMNSVREIAREWACFDREYRIGLSIRAFVPAKLIVCGAVAVAQAGVFVLVLTALFTRFPLGPTAIALTCCASLCGSILGICVSALSGTVNRAISWLPIVFIPQVFLSGILIPFDRMPDAGRFLSQLMFSRPLFALYKRAFVLENSVIMSGEWTSLFLLCSGLIIFSFAAVRWRRYSPR